MLMGYRDIMLRELQFNLMMADRMETADFYPTYTEKERADFRSIFMQHAQIAAAAIEDPTKIETLASSCGAVAKWLSREV